MTAAELRERIIATVAKNGGHLASSLGAVELAKVLSEVFDPFHDRIVWDVGHQSYAWKLLTGRSDKFGSLRTYGGISGFPLPSESLADAAVAGHAGSAISVATGLAASRDRLGGDEHVIAVVGDASLVNGMSMEALNNVASTTKRLIIVLNDNEMSISRPVGAVARFLGRIIANVQYNRVKTATENAGHRLRLTFLRRFYHSLERRIKSLFLGNAWFELMGLRYIGPVDGHNERDLTAALTVAKQERRPVVVHVVTRKGKGFAPAEADPTAWHGVGPFNLASPGKPMSVRPGSWTAVFSKIVQAAAKTDNQLVALTAGMRDGTGLTEFAQQFPERFFDVGIAEEHLVGLAAGLAAGGMHPVVAIYSTFLQRAVDQVIHDVATASLPVVFCVDRAGAVGADGVTHQGLYDFALLKTVPGLVMVEPADAEDFSKLFDEALKRQGPTVIRYARLTAPDYQEKELTVAAAKVSIWASGSLLAKARAVATALGNADVVYARYLKPFDRNRLARDRAEGRLVVSMENAAVAGGFGETIGADLKFGWPDKFLPHGDVASLERECALDVEAITLAIKHKLIAVNKDRN